MQKVPKEELLEKFLQIFDLICGHTCCDVGCCCYLTIDGHRKNYPHDLIFLLNQLLFDAFRLKDMHHRLQRVWKEIDFLQIVPKIICEFMYSYLSNKRSPTIILFWKKNPCPTQLFKTLRFYFWKKTLKNWVKIEKSGYFQNLL